MRYASVCSGIEAASVAWEPLGWEPVVFSEIEPFPIAVLKHHYPNVPVHGDFTTLIAAPPMCDLLCGGTPCQAFSIAGLRESLADDRGNLTLQFVRLANAIDHLRSTAGLEPGWVLWENVPGVLSTSDNAFGSFLGALCGRDEPIAEPSGGWTSAGVVDGPQRCAAWRILDAQHFGLAQRRKRVFVLARGGAGRWAAADALLPIIESGGWHPAPSRGTGQGATGRTARSVAIRGRDGVPQAELGDELANALLTPNGGRGGIGVGAVLAEMNMPPDEGGHAHSATIPAVAGALWQSDSEGSAAVPQTVGALSANGGTSNKHGFGMGQQDWESGYAIPVLVRMREGKEGGGKGPLVSEDKSLTLATANDQILAFQAKASASNSLNPGVVAPTLDKGKADGMAVFLHVNKGRPDGRESNHEEMVSVKDHVPTLTTNGLQNSAVATSMQVRRLVPEECEALQGFPRGYTDIPWRGKDHAPDGPRYKALGNSWAVPCARWIGERIEAVHHLDPAA